jgi:predicted nucleic acid-binding protein
MTEKVLVDTSVWVSHFRSGEDELAMMLKEENVVCHPFIIGELSCGNIMNRKEIISLLNALPQAETTTQQETLMFIEKNRLMGRGLGFIDVSLLSSAVLSGISLWTFDKSLAKAAVSLGVGRE